ncbi:MAM domain-containing protein [Cryptosporidium andersoni]|uniref:Amine oxidase n=1 Tax=Cryptosporidium andersoni TaxID=117008 RepID=A0A1J4MT80_9CRYT|nr:MAM domain-containing protein [Cryptosporidium andersoni]
MSLSYITYLVFLFCSIQEILCTELYSGFIPQIDQDFEQDYNSLDITRDNTATNKVRRVLQPISDNGQCIILLYTYGSAVPTKISDPSTSCPIAGHRSYLFEGEYGENSSASIVEIFPIVQNYTCLRRSGCTIAISGSGLSQDDMIYIIPNYCNETDVGKLKPSTFPISSPCPPQNTSNSLGPFKGVKSYGTSEIVIGDNMQKHPKHLTTVLFNIILQPNNLYDSAYICYSPARSRVYKPTDNPEVFFYNAGLLKIDSKIIFSCDFESKGYLGCGFNSLIDFQTKTRFELGNGNEVVVGSSPQADTTIGVRGKGHFLYFRAPGYMPGASALLLGNPKVYSFGTYCLSLKYFMAGADANVLRLYLASGLLGSVPLNNQGIPTSQNKKPKVVTHFGRPNWLVVGQQGPTWQLGGFEFYSDGLTPLKLVLEAIGGRSEDSLVAIDDIIIRSGHCPSEIIRASERADQKCVWGEVRLISSNFTTEKSWDIEGALGCSGRTYSFTNIQVPSSDNIKWATTDWIPCCLPGYGTYTVNIYDTFGDGWNNGNYLEFRFFDEIIRIGDLFKSGNVMKTTINVGIIKIEEIKATETLVSITIKSNRNNVNAWCALTKAGNVPPNSTTLRKYGLRTKQPLMQGDTYEFNLSSSNKGVLLPNTEYDLYCFGQDASITLESSSVVDNLAIEYSRVRITTDSKYPILTIQDLEVGEESVFFTVKLDEPGSIWCSAQIDTKTLSMNLSTIEEDKLVRDIRSKGVEQMISSRDVMVIKKVTINGLIPATKYKLICTAEDLALPKANRIPIKQVLSKLTLTFITKDRIPKVKINHVTAELGKFTVGVHVDTPGKVDCVATLPDGMYPNPRDIQRYGQSINITDPSEENFLTLVGIEGNQKYIVYCMATSRTGLSMQVTDIWSTATDITSFGQFCDIPSFPSGIETGYTTPFDPLTHIEEIKVRSYFDSIKDKYNSKGPYRITLFINKTEAYEYLDSLTNHLKDPETVPLPSPPPRYARIRFGSCNENLNDSNPEGLNGLYHQWKVGPIVLSDSEKEKSGSWGHLESEREKKHSLVQANETVAMYHIDLAEPKPVECGGWNPSGPFGRRLQQVDFDGETLNNTSNLRFQSRLFDLLSDNKLDEIVFESCGAHLPGIQDQAEQHVRLGPVVYQPALNVTSEPSIWAGITIKDGTQCPIFFELIAPHATLQSIRDGSAKIEFDRIHRMLVKQIWYNGSAYKTLDELVFSYNEAKLINSGIPADEMNWYRGRDNIRNKDDELQNRLSLVNPVILESRRIEHEQSMHQNRIRKLQYLEMFSRGDLEVRAKPEQCEPGGRRFQVMKSPNREAYTIKWIGWQLTLTNDRDSGFKIWNLNFMGRRVAFELGMIDAMAHYTVFERQWFFLDSWYGGLGTAARRVHPGLECANTAQTIFWDNSACIFELDTGRPIRSHWKTGGIKDAAPLTTLTIRQIITVSNYDYIVDLTLYNQGSFEMGVSFTGELYAGLEVPYFSAKQHQYGTQISPSGQMAALHSHFAVWKIDFDLGSNYTDNSISWIKVLKDPIKEGHHKLERTFAERESNAYLMYNETHHHPRAYFVVDENHSTYGNVGGFLVRPSHTIADLMPDHELYSGPASWSKYQLASSVFKYSELDADLPRDNKFAAKPAVRFDSFIEDDEVIRHSDIVTWVTSGIWHIPTLEDVPQTTALGNTLGWYIRPFNWWPMDPSVTLHNAIKGDFIEPGTCAVQRRGNLFKVIKIVE